MEYALPAELILLYILWRTGSLRKFIETLNAQVLLVANGKKSFTQRFAASLLRGAEYLELTRSSRFTPGGLVVWFAFGSVVASTYLAGNGPLALSQLLRFLVLFGVVGLAAIILMGGRLYVRAAQKNMARMLPEALGIMGNEIGAGHSVEAAVQRVALQFGKPLNQEFSDALVKMTASGGLISIDQALSEIAQNPIYESDELDQAALTISVVRPLGGDLGELLEDLSRLLRLREATEREIKAQLAPGRQASFSLIFIIGGLFAALTLFPLFSGLLYGTFAGRLVLIFAYIAIGIAIYWIMQINSYDI